MNSNDQYFGPLFSRKEGDATCQDNRRDSEVSSLQSNAAPTVQSAGAALRDEGIATVSENNKRWIDLCRAEAERYALFRATFTGEDLRFHCSREIGLPNHSNAWGALISYLVKRGVIEPTGEYRQMRDESSHARKTAVYRKCY